LNPPIEDLLYTLDLCADSLPFDLYLAHIRPIQEIRTILLEHHNRTQKALAQILLFQLYPLRNSNEVRDEK
jgi:hypothetical protein